MYVCNFSIVAYVSHRILAVGVVLGGVMGLRFAKSGKVMPAGIIAILRYFSSKFASDAHI